MSFVVDLPMSKGEAKALTDRIRQSVNGLGGLVEQAYDRGAWKAMEYPTWEAYVQAEFSFTRQRSYQLLDQARVTKALVEATGDLSTRVDITEKETRAIKGDLPLVIAEVKGKVAKGISAQTAVKEAVAAKRAEKKAKKAKAKAKKAAEDKRLTDALAELPPEIQQIEAYKGGKKLEFTDADRIAELEEQVRVLEAENAKLKAENSLYADLKMEYERGGFADVVARKDKVIAAMETRIARESADKAGWKRSSDAWRKKAIEAGWSNDLIIDVEMPGALNG